MINAIKLAGKKLSDITVVINGAGSAGIAIGKFLLKLGVGDLIMVDLCGIINRDENYTNPAHAEIAKLTNKRNIKGSLADALRGADAFVGVSKPNLVTPEMVQSMAEKPYSSRWQIPSRRSPTTSQNRAALTLSAQDAATSRTR